MQGAHPDLSAAPLAGGAALTAAAAHKGARSKDAVVAAADASGSLRLYKAPCAASGAKSRRYGGSTQFTQLQFAREGRSLMTVGCDDLCMFQFAVVKQ